MNGERKTHTHTNKWATKQCEEIPLIPRCWEKKILSSVSPTLSVHEVKYCARKTSFDSCSLTNIYWILIVSKNTKRIPEVLLSYWKPTCLLYNCLHRGWDNNLTRINIFQSNYFSKAKNDRSLLLPLLEEKWRDTIFTIGTSNCI